ncbi:YfhO family protein [Parasediminibacterium paludis]|uniref:YfhO family protein n=1 Tax=Parasediminibacterium paludis TaxID=908966 RepID=A0ABV8PV42_9BACT
MKKFNWKPLLPHLLAIGIFLVVSVIYCLPALKGMMVNMHDLLGAKGMAQQSWDFKDKYGYIPNWTNSMFAGMPGYQILFEQTSKITLLYFHYIFTLGLPEPANFFFLACVGFYILCVSLNIKPWIGTLASLGYAYASYSAVIVTVGHVTKFAAMGYAPAVIAGLLLLTQRKYILGFMATVLFATLQVYQNHLQITYYTLIISICLGAGFLVTCIKEKDFKHLFSTLGLAMVAGAIALGSFAVMILPTNEYTKESMRGGRSELTPKKGKSNTTKNGLDKDYAFTWSYGIDETLTLVLPAFKGGSSGSGELGGENSHVVKAMQDNSLPQDAINYFYQYMSAYWGPQTSGTSGTVYLGAITCMLFIIGLFIVKWADKGWIIAASIIGIVLAWGSHFPAVNYFLFDHLPLYNKFRAPTMSLVIPQLTFPLLGALALQILFYSKYDLTAMKEKLKWSGITVVALVAVLAFVYVGGSFKSPNDTQLKEGIANALSQGGSKEQAATISNAIMSGLTADRKGLYGSDLLRVIFFMALAGVVIWYTINKKIKPEIALIVLTAAMFVDLITVDLRYLKSDNYVDKDEFIAPFLPNAADLQIKKDTSYYRVFDQTTDPWNSSRCAYNHNSIGGYHPAKLALFQDLIENQLGKGNMEAFNMLNTKYFIVQGQGNNAAPVAQQNPGAYGNAWLVKSIKEVANADEEMKALDSVNKSVAIIDKREASKVTAQPQYDSTANITFIQNLNDYLKYESNAATNQFAVFSEIYYPYGWVATVDGKETPIVRTNYLLRGINIPAGKHTIEFNFKPHSVALGNLLGLILGIVGYIVLLGGGFLLWRNYKKGVA